ncbi:E3 ubiquitin-protein ligase synoviolin isoform X2 [Gallus gallus]|nr:E3 ubiquitin-protein ligase synoviolin isoform X2 [Gallus gallus]
MERRVDFSRFFHFLVISFLLVLMVVAVDLSISHHSLSDHTPFQLFFYFEHSILLAAVLTTISRYVLHLLEPHCGALQENRDSCALCFSFCSGLIRALLYVGFIVSMIGTRTFPLFAAQSACLAVTQFKKAAVDLFVLCFADPSGNTLLPGATPEALPAEDNACVICREEMGPEVTALPCCHVFHTSCLRSWFRQQWTCPMCRMPVQRVFYPELMPPDPPAQPPDPPARPQTPPRTSPAPEPQNWDSYEEEEEEEEQRQPLGRTLNQEMIWVYQERFTRLEDENMAAWLLRCYDSGAKGVNLEGRQLRRLGSLSNEPALDRLICRREDSSFTLWKRMLSAVRQRYRNRKYVTPRASPWFTLDEGIQRLRQLAVVEMLYADSFDPDDPRADDCPDTTKCTPQMWWQLAVSAPSDLVATMTAVQCMYHNPASVMMLTCALQDYDRNVASIQRRCVTLLEELAREVQKLSREVEQCGRAATMLCTAVVMLGSLALTTAVVAHAYYLKHQFYPTVVYLTKSSPSMAVLYIQAFVLVFLLGKFMGKVFFGQLRAAEMEHLMERSWYAVTETCLAFTVFRDDFSPRFVALFTLLLFLKCFHWLADDRVDFMERSPNISWLFHFRIISLMFLLAILDFLFVSHAYHSILTRGASVQLVFGFEYAILMTMVLTIFIKYVLHSIDLQNDNPWDSKAVYMLYTELFTGFIKVILYMAFMTIMIKVHTFPLFAIRPMYLAMRQFKKAVTDAIMSRRAIRNMNTLYPDATPEELQSTDNVCIICREEMVTGAKRLPCNHIFHTRLPCVCPPPPSCLRSWFQRQQTCPTCRMDVLRASLPPQPPPEAAEQNPAPPQSPPGAQPQNFPQGMLPPFPPGMFPLWPPVAPFPPIPGAQGPPNPESPTAAPAASRAGDGTASGSEGTAAPGFALPPPWLGMPWPPIFGLPPMPVPPPGFAGLTPEELQAMEGHERQHLEARLQCLHNIHTLLDAAMLQINQYLTVMAAIGSPRPTAPPPLPGPPHRRRRSAPTAQLFASPRCVKPPLPVTNNPP